MTLYTPQFLHVKPYDWIDFRRVFQDQDFQPGVKAATDFLCAQNGAGSMSISVGAGSAWVAGSVITRQGYYDVYNDAAVLASISPNSSGNPRIDQIVLRVYDSADGNQNQDAAAVETFLGTPTAGATLNNRSGVQALPPSCILLADVLVANGAASILNSAIRDRRPWSRGAHVTITRNANAAAGTDYQSASGSLVLVDATNLNPRIECSGGNPVVMRVSGSVAHSVANSRLGLQPMLDSAAVDGGAKVLQRLTTAGQSEGVAFEWLVVPAAGSHTFGLGWFATDAGTMTLRASATDPVQWSVREDIRQNVANNPAGYG